MSGPSKSRRIASYLPEAKYKRFFAFAEERSISESQAIKIILDEYFEQEPLREAIRSSDQRQIEVLEFLFTTASYLIAEKLPDSKTAIFNEFVRNCRAEHPHLFRKDKAGD